MAFQFRYFIGTKPKGLTSSIFKLVPVHIVRCTHPTMRSDGREKKNASVWNAVHRVILIGPTIVLIHFDVFDGDVGGNWNSFFFLVKKSARLTSRNPSSKFVQFNYYLFYSQKNFHYQQLIILLKRFLRRKIPFSTNSVGFNGMFETLFPCQNVLFFEYTLPFAFVLSFSIVKYVEFSNFGRCTDFIRIFLISYVHVSSTTCVGPFQKHM